MAEDLGTTDPGRIGPFRLTGRLGEGTMGTVYLGRSQGGRLVTVKVVNPALAGDLEFRRRFAHQVATARMVGGFHTAEVVGAETDAAIPWLATGYIPGPTLREAVEAHGPLPHQAVAVLAAGLAEGLAAIHSRGVVHRDLKPANVILAEDGPRIIDVGIAHAMETTNLSTTIGDSAVFLSPEQVRGLPTGPAADVFALGCVLAFAATGRHPFGDTAPNEVLRRVMTEQPDLSGVPAPLAGLVNACLAKDPAARPPVAAILHGLAGPVPPGTPWLPPNVAAMTERPARNGRRAVLTAGLAVVAAAVSVPVGIAFAPRETGTLVPGGDAAAPAATGGPTLTRLATIDLQIPNAAGTKLAFSPDGKTLAVTVEEGLALWDLASRTKTTDLPVTAPLLGTRAVAYSPDGTLALAFGSYDGLDMDIGAIQLWDTSGGPVATLMTGSDGGVTLDPMDDVSFSADGGIVAGCSAGTEGVGRVHLWDIAAEKQIEKFVVGESRGTSTAAVRSVRFSPDGSTLVAGWGSGLSGGLAFWDTASYTQEELSKMDTGAFGVTDLSFSADGTRLAAGYSGVGVWDVVSRGLIIELVPATNTGQAYTSVAISPDGKTVAASHANGVELWDVASGASLGNYVAGRSGVGAIAFSPDGKTLAGIADSSAMKPVVELWTVA